LNNIYRWELYFNTIRRWASFRTLPAAWCLLSSSLMSIVHFVIRWVMQNTKSYKDVTEERQLKTQNKLYNTDLCYMRVIIDY